MIGDKAWMEGITLPPNKRGVVESAEMSIPSPWAEH